MGASDSSFLPWPVNSFSVWMLFMWTHKTLPCLACALPDMLLDDLVLSYATDLIYDLVLSYAPDLICITLRFDFLPIFFFDSGLLLCRCLCLHSD